MSPLASARFGFAGAAGPVEFDVEYLIIAGGGGGGSTGDEFNCRGASGGGAGGYRSSVTGELTGGGGSAETALTITTGDDIAVEVGAGGNGSNQTNSRGFNLAGYGNDSIFSTITADQGSGGASGDGSGYATTLSGSAGGRSHFSGGRNTAIVTTPVQGNYSGYSNTGNYFTLGGGGGAGSVGGNGNGNNSGNGGNGRNSSITGTSVGRAGGGGGGGSDVSNARGGFGIGPEGGGNAGSSGGANGTVNTGGGGGGGVGLNNANGGGDGGSGVVILLYPDNRSISFGAGVVGTETDRGDGYKYANITSGSGNVSFS